jgi:chain length determinant protein (polysaccharide antigen chain regulator)
MQNSSIAPRNSDEIDLQELVAGLWAQGRLIIGVTIFAGILAGAYAFLSKPVYEAKGYLIPPTQNDVANINYGRTKELDLAPYTVKDIYNIFTLDLQSESLRREFYKEVYLPSLSESERKEPQDTLYADFAKKVTVPAPTRDDRYSVVVQNNDPTQAVAWVQEYVKRAGDLAEKELAKNVSLEAKVRARNIEQQINSLRETGKKIREDSLTKLREALKVAEAIDLEKPPIIMGNPSVGIAGSMEDQLIYMRGSKALKAEIENLSVRSSDDPFINELRTLQAKYNFYKGIEINPLDVRMYRLDGMVGTPDNPVKPKKALILVLGLMSGLMLGLVIAFARLYISRSARVNVSQAPNSSHAGGSEK